MRNPFVIIAYAVFALTLVLLQAGAAVADDTAENAAISEVMKLYTQAVPMDLLSPERAALLEQSAAILQQFIDNNPQSLEAHRKLMGVYLLQQDYSKAIRTMQDAITLSPEDPKLFIGLAFLYEHSGAFEYAEAMLDQALALDPDQALAKDYKVAIRQKIAARSIDDLHQGVEAGHGTAAGGTHSPVDTPAHPPIDK